MFTQGEAQIERFLRVLVYCEAEPEGRRAGRLPARRNRDGTVPAVGGPARSRLRCEDWSVHPARKRAGDNQIMREH